MEQTVPPTWWSRNWKWFVPVGCLSSLALLAAFVGLIFVFVSGLMTSSGAYRQALAKAAVHPEVVRALGTPIKDGFFTSGQIQVSGPSGHAELAIPISGPEGKATLYLEARKSTGEWSFSKLVVELRGSGRRIDLLDQGEGQLGPSPASAPD